MVILRYDPSNVSLIKRRPEMLFVFEDTLARDHILSTFKNCIGIPVKYHKHFGSSGKFEDRPIEFEVVHHSLELITSSLSGFTSMAFPEKQLGSDTANWGLDSPKLSAFLSYELERRFKFKQ